MCHCVRYSCPWSSKARGWLSPMEIPTNQAETFNASLLQRRIVHLRTASAAECRAGQGLPAVQAAASTEGQRGQRGQLTWRACNGGGSCARKRRHRSRECACARELRGNGVHEEHVPQSGAGKDPPIEAAVGPPPGGTCAASAASCLTTPSADMAPGYLCERRHLQDTKSVVQRVLGLHPEINGYGTRLQHGARG